MLNTNGRRGSTVRQGLLWGVVASATLSMVMLTSGLAGAATDPVALCHRKVAAGASKYLKKLSRALYKCQIADQQSDCLGSLPARTQSKLDSTRAKARRSMASKCGVLNFAASGAPTQCSGYRGQCSFAITGWDEVGADNDVLDCVLCMHEAAARGLLTAQVRIPRCGDGAVNVAGEACDDGNSDDTDACLGTCSAASCGDGFVQAGVEQCDDGAANSDTMADACRSDCRSASCGDSVVDSGEQCDEGGETAVCNANCNSALCGDGVVNASAGEVCDDGGESGTCNLDCTIAQCGDGQVNATAGETCDDGNADNTDSCLNDCSTASCGDGFLQAGVEACDNGAANSDTVVDACRSDCSLASCGDAVVDSGEACDDGNADNTDSCLNDCSAASCGDGFVQAGVEACDTAGESASCNADCSAAACGDGILNLSAGEACDTAGESSSCNADCSAAACGDGILNVSAGEACDTAGESASCNADCSVASCGDGILNLSAGEACDTAGESGTCNLDCTLAQCGDGQVNATAGEACDDGNADNTDSCLNACSAASCGDGFVHAGVEACDTAGESSSCNADCSVAACGDGILNESAGEACDTAGESSSCNADCSVAACGDGKLNTSAGEFCDDGNADNTDSCLGDCTLPSCGDGFVQLGVEACDNGAANSDTVADACRTDCSAASCGDLVVDSGEACDDGNALNSDSCLNDCTLASCGDGFVQAGVEACDTAGESTICNTDCTVAVCGDGKVNTTAGEACDTTGESATCNADCSVAVCGDGQVNASAGEACDTAGESASCNSDCSVAVCGDGKVNLSAGEACDAAGESAICDTDCTLVVCGDGLVNASAGEACDTAGESASCNVDCSPAVCGDGKLNPSAGEACDDANGSNTDGCLTTCLIASCGDGFLYLGVEQCDDGAANSNTVPDACRLDCTPAVCGDGVADSGEDCDDGNADNTDACLNDCSAASCGDGFVQAGVEACDTAGETAACNANCTVSVCGDGVVNNSAGEDCDTAGESASCNADCTTASCGDGKLNTSSGEFCDDGNADNTDACLDDCSVASCGDGFVQAGVEACDTAGESASCNIDCTVALCGDGQVNASAGEACDSAGESVSCNADCSVASCGDGQVNSTAGEVCDDGNVDNTDACLNDCSAASCGDGFVYSGVEQCDAGAGNSNTIPDACRLDCTAPACGDGVTDSGEACDDGNASNSDACLNDCTVASCGDGFVQAGVEACDDGNSSNGDACLNSCTVAACGDGFVYMGMESCDDGNADNTDACLNDCSVASCGDGFVYSGMEQCDNGSANSDTVPDACRLDCTVPVCGDGVTDSGEGCDDGNGSNSDACLNDCSAASCGDGFRWSGVEDCDDGNASNNDACLNDCTAASCGDGFVETGVEQCDDGNAINTDACLSDCTAASCGDGFVQAGVEQCDDGNTLDTDNCSSGCLSQRVLTADVVALDQAFTFNRWGASQPAGMMYALRSDVVDLLGNPIGPNGGLPGQVMLRPGKRPRPLILRANQGDVLQVRFTNLLSPIRTDNGSTLTRLASMLVNSTEILGNTHDPVATGLSGVAPGDSTTYYWRAGDHDGTYLFYSNGAPGGGEGDGGQITLGLFGALNVEPAGSVWYRSQVTASEMAQARAQAVTPAFINYDAVDVSGRPILRILGDNNELLYGDLNALVVFDEPDDGVLSTTEGRFREFSVLWHDEVGAVQAYALLDDPVMRGVSDSFALNYGVEALGPRIVANRLGEAPLADCVECAYEEFFLESHASGDPALLPQYEADPSNVHHSYLSDKVKFRNIHAGPRETHIFHLHAHQWLAAQGSDTSAYLDSQTIAPMTEFTFEIQYGGSGNRNLTAGDSIFHCHLYPHFAQGMWELWRVHDTFEDGTRRLPDGALGPGTDPMTGVTLGGTPIPAVVPMPALAMAPQPSYGPTGMPGYPFYIAGIAGHRPSQPPFDIAVDGGLPRHYFTSGTRQTGAGRPTFDFSVVVDTANLTILPNDGTPLEKNAMDFHAGVLPGMHDCGVDTLTPEGLPGLFKVNCLPPAPGAPYADPCPPAEMTAERNYHVSFIELDLLANSAGWHDPQGRINVLDSDVPLFEGQLTTADPFFFRANSGECVNFFHTNRAPKQLALDDFQVVTPTDTVGQHIHLVKFDVTSSDGSGNGWNYEDGTFARDAIVEWIDATNAPGGSAVDLNGQPVVLSATGDFQTTVQRWWADPLLNKLGQDRTIRTVFTHDHFAPSSWQQHGFYNALVVEPAGSHWLTPDGTVDLSTPLDPARGVGTQTQIISAADPAYHPDHREFMLAVADLALLYTPAGVPVNPPPLPEAISTANGVDLVNYKNQPLETQLGTAAQQFSSWVNDDPFTEIYKAYEGERVQLRVIQGAQTAQHTFNLHGHSWPQEVANPNSGLISAQTIGISEHFELDLGIMPPVPGGGVADYLYHSGANVWVQDGAWGLMRVYGQGIPFDTPLATLKGMQLGAAAVGERDVCPPGAPVASFDVEAWAAADLLPGGALVYNYRDDIYDPNGKFFILAGDRAAYQAGAKDPEPLVLRARAGDCVVVNLANMLSVGEVSLHQQRMSADPRYSDGANVGLNFLQTALPGQTISYRWYAGSYRNGVAEAIELGPSNLRSYGDFRFDAAQGLLGAFIVEPAGAVWSSVDTGLPIDSGTVARVALPDGSSFKEFVLMYQEELDLYSGGGPIPDAKVDKFEKGFNYATEQYWARLGVSTAVDLNDVQFPVDFMMGPIETPLFTAIDGEPVRFHVLQPSGTPLQHAFVLQGHQYWDNRLPNFLSEGATIMSPGVAKTLDLMGGARAGTWLYRDGAGFGAAGGLWGRFEVQ